MSAQCILMKYRILHTNNPPYNSANSYWGDVYFFFFLRFNSPLEFQTLLRFQTLSPEQHLLHLKNVTNLEFPLIANTAS